MDKNRDSGNLQNEAFIDGQNLHFGTVHAEEAWKVDVIKFREYLRAKFKVERAYYFLGCFNESLRKMYTGLQEAGYILVFRAHQQEATSHKKGNIDTDLVFYIMYKLYKRENLDKVVLVSGDGDYYRVVRFLIEENRLEKILFPSWRNASSLYHDVEFRYKMCLSAEGVKNKISYTENANKKEGDCLGI